MTLGRFLAWFWNLLVLQRHGVFPPAGDFFEAVLRQQPQATEAVEKCCFSRISEVTLGTFLAWFWNLLVLQRHGVFPPAGDFFEAVLLQQPQATEAVEKCCFSRISEVTLGTFLAWFWNLLVLQRHGVFPPAGDFFEAVLLQQPQATEAVEKCCFSRISEVTLGTFLAWFWNLLVLQRHGVFPPAGDFFEAVLLQQPQATEAVEKCCFSRISEVTLGTFLAWFWNLLVLQRHGVFPPAGDFFEAVLLQQPQATEAVEKCCFSRISEVTLGTFLAWFWNLLVLQRHGVFPPAGDFFEAVLLQQPQATEAVEKCCFSRISEVTLGTFLAWFWNLLVLQRHGVFPPAGDFFEAVLLQQPLATEAVEKCCFSRISEVTLGTFLAWFWNLLVLQRHGVFPPAGDFFEAVLLQQPQATEAVEKCCFSRISEVTLGTFLAWFWNLLVLQRHGVFPPAGDFFEAVLLQQPQATEAVEKCCFSRISEVTLGTFLAWFWNLLVLQRHGVFPPAGDFFEAVLLQQPQATEAVEKCCFSRISEVTLGTFLAWFWNLLVLQRHGVFPPAGDFFEAVLLQQPQATEAVEKCCFSRISEVTLGTFLAWFWNLLVLQRHGVFPPAGDFFEAVLLQQPQATEAVEKCCFSRISEVTLGTFLAWFWNLLVLQRHGVFPPAGDFFEVVLLQHSQATEAVEKCCFSKGFPSIVTMGPRGSDHRGRNTRSGRRVNQPCHILQRMVCITLCMCFLGIRSLIYLLYLAITLLGDLPARTTSTL